MKNSRKDEAERPDYFALMKQSRVYIATKNILEQDGDVKPEELEKTATFRTNSIFCFYFIKDHHEAQLAQDAELSDYISRAIMFDDEAPKEEGLQLARDLESKITELRSMEVPDYALAGVYEFMADRLGGYGEESTDKLTYLVESFRLWPENDDVYDQLVLFYSTILKKSHFEGEECFEAEMAENIRNVLSEKRPDRFIKEQFEIINGSLSMLGGTNEEENPDEDYDLLMEPDTRGGDPEDEDGSGGTMVQ